MNKMTTKKLTIDTKEITLGNSVRTIFACSYIEVCEKATDSYIFYNICQGRYSNCKEHRKFQINSLLDKFCYDIVLK